MTASKICRRAVLKGLGVSVALPWLKSIAFSAQATASQAPKRFACLFLGDGISPPHWWARGAGKGMELGRSLEPLAPFKEKINVIHGVFNREGDNDHGRYTGNILSGAALQRGRIIRGGVSMDQRLARRFEEETAVPSLVLGCEQPVSGFLGNQYSMVYASHISWSSPDSPIPLELNPALAFDSLFGSQVGRLQGSILDQVREMFPSIWSAGRRFTFLSGAERQRDADFSESVSRSRESPSPLDLRLVNEQIVRQCNHPSALIR